MGLIAGSKGCGGGAVAALAVFGSKGWALGGKYTCGVVVLMTCEAGVQSVAALTVAGSDGGDVFFCIGIGYQGGTDLDIYVACRAGVFMDSYWFIRCVADADAFRGIKNLAGTCGAVVGAVNLEGLG